MRYFLENEKLKVEIDSFGAEVKSVLNKNGCREYMWYGNPKYWGRTSPVLFPFVGSVANGVFIYDGKEYAMKQHGFARDMEHKLIKQTERAIEFELRSDELTLSKFPFEFCLNISYELKGNELSVRWQVNNPDSKDLYFQIGAHPAFLCPIHGEPDKSGYRLYFEGCNEIIHHGNDVKSGMALMDERLVLPLKDHRAVLTGDFFDRCTYFVEGRQCSRVGLEEPDGSRIVEVSFDAPLFAIWSPEGKNAPFLCIEPWYGRTDAAGSAADLKTREYTNILKPGGDFSAEYRIYYY